MFRVVGDSMRPTLAAGRLVLARYGGEPRRGQLRVFRDPHRSTRWLVKRVGEVYPSDYGAAFEARSDDPAAAMAGDSNTFGPVAAAGTYRVVWPRRSRTRPGTR